MRARNEFDQLQMTTLKLSNLEFKILRILWASENSMSIKEITEQTGYRIAGETIVRYIMDNLITKGVVYQSGVYRNYIQDKEVVKNYYSPKIHFEEYLC